MRLTGYAHLLGFVTDKRDRERRIGGNRQCKLPVSSGRRTGRRTLCHNRSTDDRFSFSSVTVPVTCLFCARANEQKLSTVINDSTIFLIISVNLKIEFEIKSSEQI